jgi:hypothetical protein
MMGWMDPSAFPRAGARVGFVELPARSDRASIGGMPASSPAANRPDHRQGLASAATCPWIAGFAGISQ